MFNIRQDYSEDRRTTQIDMWYDFHLHMWTLQPKDDEGFQTAPVEYAVNKQTALILKAEMEADMIGKEGE